MKEKPIVNEERKKKKYKNLYKRNYKRNSKDNPGLIKTSSVMDF